MARAAVNLPITDLYFQFAIRPDWKITFGQPVRITDKAYAIAGEEAGEERLGILWVRQDPTMRWIVERHAKASVCCRRNRGLSLQRFRDLTRHPIARVMAAEQGNAELPVLRDREREAPERAAETSLVRALNGLFSGGFVADVLPFPERSRVALSEPR